MMICQRLKKTGVVWALLICALAQQALAQEAQAQQTASKAEAFLDTAALLDTAPSFGGFDANPYPAIDSQRMDQVSAKALQALARGELRQARALLQDLVIDFPKYRLGQLLFAELHAANTSLPSSLERNHYTQEFMDLLLEASTRLRHSDRLSSRIITSNAQPKDLLKIGNGLEHWVQVDLEQGTQSIFEINNGLLQKRWEQYVGYGAGGFDKFKEGDLKTPLGIYRIDGYRSDTTLPELYGTGALTLDYPNLADRHENRTGSGIWLHGVPRHNRSRGPLSSEGCVIMSNDYIDTLHALVNPSSTLVALSSASAINNPNVHLDNLKAAFLSWRAQRIRAAAEDAASLRWEDITVAVSGATSVNGEPQNLVMYFQSNRTTELSSSEWAAPELPAFKALFWKRRAPNENTWTLIGDEST